MSFKTQAFGAVTGMLIAGGAMAAPVTPTFGTFGDIADAGVDTEFGGDGISGANTAYDTFTDGEGNTLTLGLTITPRYSAPVPKNDGAGTFTVQPGLATSAGEGTLWNFSFYAGLTSSGQNPRSLQNIGLELLYDLDSSAGTDIDDLGSIEVARFTGSETTLGGSQNLSFNYLSEGVDGFNTPGTNNFDPNTGEYSFLLRANEFTPEAAGGVAVQVNVAPVPLPAGLPLMLVGLGGLAFLRKRKAA